jgi:hypothetical protein
MPSHVIKWTRIHLAGTRACHRYAICHMNRGFGCQRGRRPFRLVQANNQQRRKISDIMVHVPLKRRLSRHKCVCVPSRASFTHLHQLEFASPLTRPLATFWFAVKYCKVIRDISNKLLY